jgi:GT2 family glycosyltransferase
MELLASDEDWACFLDHDAMFTTTDWFSQLEDIIAENPEYGLLSAITNRTGNTEQKVANIDYDNHDIRYHRSIGAMAQEQNRTTVTDVSKTRSISGVVMLVKKAVWRKAGGFASGFLAVDNDFHQRVVNVGGKVGIMKGVYVYHWYRFEGSDLKPVAIIEIKCLPRKLQRIVYQCVKKGYRCLLALFKRE